MATKQGYIKNYGGDKMLPQTTSTMVTDVAKEQALSATLANTPDKNTLGFPAFTTIDAYSTGDKVYYNNKLWVFSTDHAAGEWDETEVSEFSVKEYVDALVSSDSATFRGTFNLVSDLGLGVDATHTQIGAALDTEISTKDNNDYCYVQVPTSAETPTEIAKVERYKFDGTEFAFEYELNNSGFTTAQWAAINSGITTALVEKLTALPTADELYTKEQTDERYLQLGSYSASTAVGLADNLRGQTVDSEAYLIRPTGGDSNEVANGVASVLGMEGNSVVWNQLFYAMRSMTGEGIITEYNSETHLISITNVSRETNYSSGSTRHPVITSNELLVGHKYYIKPNKNIVGITFYNSSTTGESYNSNSSYINTHSAEGEIVMRVTSEYDFVNEHPIGDVCSFYLNIIDLTRLGIDNLTTTAQVEAWLAQHPGTKPYYAYNAGTILSAQTLGIKTYGQNLLNPTTKQAKLIPYEWEENSNVYTIKNVPSGATATFTPDNTGVAETVDISGGSLDITSYGSGILELSAATADTYVCMKWDGQKDDDVVPYEDHTYDFDVKKVYGKTAGSDTYVQCFPNGMRSAVSIHDTLTASGAVVKVGSVDLGDLNWTYSVAQSVFYATGPSDMSKRTRFAELICNKYLTKTTVYNIAPTDSGYIWVNDEEFSSSTPRVYLRDTNHTSWSGSDNWLDGVIAYYKLATPVTYTDLIYRDNGIDRPLADVLMNIEVNNWSMEEQLLTPYENGNPTSIPATIKTQYGMDAVEAIDTLQKTCYFADDVRANLQALLTCINTNCAETLGGTFSISDTATDKVFEFTFTPNTEPEP